MNTTEPVDLRKPLRIYVASRATPERAAMWRALRDEGVPIISTWIDESGEDLTIDYAELWDRIKGEVMLADLLILYAEPGDFPLKGAFVEAGMALAIDVPIAVVLPGVGLESRTMRHFGSWVMHPSVKEFDTVKDAVHEIATLRHIADQFSGPG